MRKIDESILVKNLMIKNRLVMPPMATGRSNPDGSVSDSILAYYDEKSAGGYIGLIITEHCFILQEGKASNGQMSMADGCDLPSIQKLTSTIHKNGSAVFCQINHAGNHTKPEVTGMDIVNIATVDQKQLIEGFAKAAKRVKDGGFDGVEIHSAHGYLLNQFYSPKENPEPDLSKRISIHLEVIKAVREAVGPDYPIALRLGACDYMEGGSTIDDAVIACKAFEKAGVDLLDISGGFCGYVRKDNTEPGWFCDATEAIKESVSIPVILTGGVTEISQAEALLQERKADMIGVGRAIYKDSLWAENAMKQES